MTNMSHLSEYEELREKNIARNREVMKALGLDQFDFDAHAANGKTGKISKSETKKPAPKRKRDGGTALPTHPARRSSRVAGLAPPRSDEVNGDPDETNASGRPDRASVDLRGSAEEHALAEAEHLRWAGRQGKVTIVGTASYQHTLMRVRTMVRDVNEKCGKIVPSLKLWNPIDFNIPPSP